MDLVDAECPHCGAEVADCEPGQEETCPSCGMSFHVEDYEDPAELYAEREEAERERWIPNRSGEPRQGN